MSGTLPGPCPPVRLHSALADGAGGPTAGSQRAVAAGDSGPAAPPRRAVLGAMASAVAGVVSAGAVAWPALAGATPGFDEPPLPQAPRPLLLPAWSRHTLANGLRLVVVPRPELPLVSAVLLVRAGPEADPTGHPGVAQMLATLLTKGARRSGRAVNATTLARQAEALGGTLDSHAAWGATTLAMTVTSPRLPAALALMADALRQPLLAADELERARAQALDGLRVALGEPAQVAALVLRRAHWGATAYGAVAPPAALKRLRRAELRQFHSTWVRPELTTLVLAGDVTGLQGLTLADRLLGDWQSNQPLPALAAPARAEPVATPLVLVDMPGSGQSGVAVAAPYIGSDVASARERRIGQVANAVLGTGYSSRLNQEVRIKRGLSYGAGSGVEAFPGAGMFSASAQTQHATAAEVLGILRGEVARLADAPPSADELAARQATLVGSFVRRLETTDGLAGLVQGQLVLGRPLDELGTYVDDVMAVTPQQVSDFARTHWRADTLRAVVAGDLAAAGSPLAALADGAWRITLPELDLEAPALRRR